MSRVRAAIAVLCNDAPAPGALAGLLSLLFDDSMRRCLPELPPEAGLPVPDSWLKRLDMEGPFWQAHWLLWRLREAAGTETDTAACKALAESLTLQIKVAFDEVEFAPNESTSMTQLRLTGAIASLTSRPSVCTLWWDFVATLAAAATLNGSVSMEIATSTTDDGLELDGPSRNFADLGDADSGSVAGGTLFDLYRERGRRSSWTRRQRRR